MQQFLELIPVLLFVIVYNLKGKAIDIGSWHHEFDGIYSATAVLIAATVIQFAITTYMKRRVEKQMLFVLAAVIIFGGATLLFHDGLFIKWKPTVFNWSLGLALLVSHFWGKKNLMEKLLGAQLVLPHFVWVRINFLWCAYFFMVGALNLYVAYNYPEEFWVHYKLYSGFGFTVLMAVITAVMVAPYISEDKKDTPET